jgi:hypothetical protein
MIINRSGQIELVRFKQDSNAPASGIRSKLDWIWDGQGLPGGANAGGK